ncbi:hypothetical protein [Nonlabens xiamenensis]|uniref:hypothetical protein n=1 Tax=Nonlabens xiamenensis TaxID=2341043 RepID=UPI000F611A55|nr:hypothetical protein [Nonlabens xiamenensis]
MFKCILGLFIFLGLVQFLPAQTIEAVNEADIGIPDVRILIEDADHKILFMGNTDAQGTLQLPELSGSVSLRTFHLSYEEHIQRLELPQKRVKIQLIKKVNQLDEITFQLSGFIKRSGDTTTISLPKIKDGKERSVLDLLKKIPGVELLEDGSVIFENHRITDVLINGKKLFDENYKTTLENIQPHKMTEVQFITNYDDDSILEEKEHPETAMNLGFEREYFSSASVDIGAGNAFDMGGTLLNSNSLTSSYHSYKFNNYGKALYRRRFSGSTSGYSEPEKVNLLEEHSLDYLNFAGSSKNDDINESHFFDNNIAVQWDNSLELNIKNNNIWEQLERENTNLYQFFDDDNTIRTDRRRRMVDYTHNDFAIKLKKKWKKRLMVVQLDGRQLRYGKNERNLLNNIENLNTIRTNVTDFGIYLNYQDIENTKLPFTVQGNFYQTELDESFQSIGLSNFDQELKKKNSNLHLALDKRLYSSQKLGLQLSSENRLESYHLKLNNMDTLNEETYFIHGLEGRLFQPQKQFQNYLSLGYRFLRYQLDDDTKVAMFYPYLDAKWSTQKKNRKWNYQTALTAQPLFIRNQWFNRENLFVDFNRIVRNDLMNEVAYRVDGRFEVSYRNGHSKYTSLFNFEFQDKSVFIDFDIDENISIISYARTDAIVYRLNKSFSFDTLLWSSFFLKISNSNSIQNSYYRLNTSNSQIDENSILGNSLGVELKRRHNKQLYLGSKASINSFRIINQPGLPANFDYHIEFFSDVNWRQFKFYPKWKMTKFKNSETYQNLSLEISYTPEGSQFHFGLRAFNLLDNTGLNSLNINNIYELRRQTNILERRGFVYLSYNF